MMFRFSPLSPARRQLLCRTVLLSLLAGGFTGGALAQDKSAYPRQPIKLVVPFAPGGQRTSWPALSPTPCMARWGSPW